MHTLVRMFLYAVQKLLKLVPLDLTARKAEALMAIPLNLFPLLLARTTWCIMVLDLPELKAVKAPLLKLPGDPTVAPDVSVY